MRIPIKATYSNDKTQGPFLFSFIRTKGGGAANRRQPLFFKNGKDFFFFCLFLPTGLCSMRRIESRAGGYVCTHPLAFWLVTWVPLRTYQPQTTTCITLKKNDRVRCHGARQQRRIISRLGIHVKYIQLNFTVYFLEADPSFFFGWNS